MNLLEKFEQVDVQAKDVYSKADMGFFEKIVAHFVKVDKINEQARAVEKELSNELKLISEEYSIDLYAWNKYEDKLTMGRRKYQNDFVGRVAGYIEKTYDVELDREPLRDYVNKNGVSMSVIEVLAKELGGDTFEERSKQQRLKTARSAFKNLELKIKKNKVVVADSYIRVNHWLGDEYQVSNSSGRQAVVCALKFFERVNFIPKTLEPFAEDSMNGDKKDLTVEMSAEPYDKVKGVKLYMNGRLDIRFDSNASASEFVELLGTEARSVA